MVAEYSTIMLNDSRVQYYYAKWYQSTVLLCEMVAEYSTIMRNGIRVQYYYAKW